ncbi:phosphoribosyl-ATP diphosphatase [Candidatus Gottesmanbacteria bacterium RBG_16_37_8]|uniref:Phosphoribosyl-ATP pyrophosphatase n=1 Tax=Candidatus Gottesmanbacteria bacterium RBG_16_37_8 TaxID=1798371 RepID=A0A1F5YTR6_9BACT|nr:MAG: phosphoribosyl-ATP diphosphatase [Candidatus Gottesmanbacteria bacterium RBG_16_37_8]
MTLEELYQKIRDRKKAMPENSYVASLFREGRDRIIKKVGEEATEVIIAVKNNNKKEIISEVTDLWFHLLVLLADNNITIKDIILELTKRDKNNQRSLL